MKNAYHAECTGCGLTEYPIRADSAEIATAAFRALHQEESSTCGNDNFLVREMAPSCPTSRQRPGGFLEINIPCPA